jgi:hypothetical protein
MISLISLATWCFDLIGEWSCPILLNPHFWYCMLVAVWLMDAKLLRIIHESLRENIDHAFLFSFTFCPTTVLFLWLNDCVRVETVWRLMNVDQLREWELAGEKEILREIPASVLLCPQHIPHDDLGSSPGRRGDEPATNRLSYDMTCYYYYYYYYKLRKRTIPTERPPLVGEVSANFCG